MAVTNAANIALVEFAGGWALGHTPGLFARYVWKKAPLSSALAVSIGIVSFIVLSLAAAAAHEALGVPSLRTTASIVAVSALFSIATMKRDKRGKREHLIRGLRTMIADPMTSDDRRALAKDKLDQFERKRGKLAFAQGASPSRESQAEQPELENQPIPTADERFGSPEKQEEAFENFRWAALRAISRFAGMEYQRLARVVREDIRGCPACGPYEDYNYRNLWDQYCQEVVEGPSFMESAWEQTIAPHIVHRLTELSHTTAVLLTLSAQWDDDDFEGQDGGARDDDRLYQELALATSRLADQEPGHLWEDEDQDDEFEHGAEDSGPEPRTPQDIVGNRRFEELSAAEKAQFGRLHKAESQVTVNALEANLNRHKAATGHGDRPSEGVEELWFREIEDRPVAKGLSDGKTFAFVFDAGTWGAAGDLVEKVGPSLSMSELTRSFPEASAAIAELKALSKDPPRTAFR